MRMGEIILKIAIYARISKEGENIDNQLVQLKTYCDQKNYPYTIYQETITGTGKVRRPIFEQMMEDAKKGKFDAILVWAYDRFSRAGIKDIHWIVKLNEWNVKFISYQEPFLDTSSNMGELMLPIFSWLAKQEAVRISERTKAGLELRKKAGVVLGRPKVDLDVASCIKDRELGMSYTDLSRKYSVPRETIRRHINMASKIAQKG